MSVATTDPANIRDVPPRVLSLQRARSRRCAQRIASTCGAATTAARGFQSGLAPTGGIGSPRNTALTGGGDSGTSERFPPLPLGLLRVLRPTAETRPAPFARDTVAATRTGDAPALRPRASGVGVFRGRPARGGLFSAMCSSASAARGLADADDASSLPAPVLAAEPAPAAPPAKRLSADARTARENDAADDYTNVNMGPRGNCRSQLAPAYSNV